MNALVVLWLKLTLGRKFKVKRLSKRTVYIVTPLLDRHNDMIVVYVTYDGPWGYIINDASETIHDLESCGFVFPWNEPEAPINACVEYILKGNEWCIRAVDELMIPSRPRDLAADIWTLAERIHIIANLPHPQQWGVTS